MKKLCAVMDRVCNLRFLGWARTHRPVVVGIAVALLLTVGGARTALMATTSCGDALLFSLQVNQDAYQMCVDSWVPNFICSGIRDQMNNEAWAEYYICALTQQ